MSILEGIGKKALISAVGTGVVVHGFSKGFAASGANQSIYELATGNPNIDKDVLGTSLTPMQALMPVPGVGRIARATMRPSPYFGVAGGGLVGGVGGAIAGKIVGHGKIGAAIGAGLGATLGGAVAPLSGAAQTGFLNGKMLGGAFSSANKPFVEPRNAYSPNAFPSADGSIVFGMNNARHGA